MSTSGSSSIASCSSTVLSALLTDQYIDQCQTDSGYSFTEASIPTQDVIDLMCASSACRSLLADAEAMDLSECILPVGDHIRLLADLIDYVPARCPSATGSAAAGSTTTESTVIAGSTSGNDTASSSDTVTAPTATSSSTPTASSDETSTTTTTSASQETASSTAASASAAASASSSGSSAASPVGRAMGVLSIAAMSVVLALM
ncbi:elicitin [Phytophthora sojae]|uniref:Elicitin n=2 Tax=Phytophthora sojae TaxID=67593 RepID=G5A7Y2_PHYSP|nr:elicitin [Phytophthora sojae]ABB56022.1 elicitin-like protein SOL2A [Phytophthora sojae]EGZ08008.1 elicitin [Phytophthora sojae]|eukprot:XP_009536180.1 elicitin [Phytophthora sojae]